jgi:3-hydroxybutyrate dehydrogenase
MLKGKSAIVTGSTSGIGLGIAHALAAEGCNIMLNGFGDKAAIDAEIKNFKEKYRGVNIDYSPADMSKAGEIADMVAQCERVLGSCDVLVNNAGIQFTANIEDFPAEKWDAIISINLSATFHAIKAAMPGMKKRNYGRIINIASTHGLVASKQKVAYVAAKHGIVGLTKAVALESADQDITCNAICPGWVHTPLVQKQIDDRAAKEGITVQQATDELLGEKQPKKVFNTPETIGAMAVFLCGKAGTAMTGEILTMSGGWVAQ